MDHYVVPDSVSAHRFIRNPGVLLKPRRLRPARSNDFNYDQLKEIMAKRAGQPGMPATQSLGNLNSALDGFLEAVGIEPTDPIGPNLRLAFYKRRRAFLARLAAEDRPAAYVANQKHYLNIWFRLVKLRDKEQSAHEEKSLHPFQSALRALFGPNPGGKRATIKGTCRTLDIPLSTLRGWLAGNAPKCSCYTDIRKIERSFGLEEGELIDLLPQQRVKRPAVRPMNPSNAPTKGAESPIQPLLPVLEYRARLSRLHGDHYAQSLKEVNLVLKHQWITFVKEKVNPTPDDENPTYWLTRREPHRRPTPYDWIFVVNGKVSHTARHNFQYLRCYWGWLQRAIERGGLGMDSDTAQSLAQVVNIEALDDYSKWREERADDRVSRGITGFLQIVLMLSNPKYGFLPRHPEIGETIGITDAAKWRAKCSKAHDYAQRNRRRWDRKSESSRNPFVAAQKILDLDNPLTAVRDAMTHHRLARPITGEMRQSRWRRDHLLIGFLASNAPRIRNIRQMTWRPDNTGNLYQDSAGGWKLRYPKREVKNVEAYDTYVQKSLWPIIEDYLRDSRPKLCGSVASDLFFICPRAPDKEWIDVDRHFARLFGRHFVGVHPCGPHIMRHIVATAILKLRPGAFFQVAKVLNDTLQTVTSTYAHLRPDDSSDILESSFSESAELRIREQLSLDPE